MSKEPRCYVDAVRFQQEADGYDTDMNVQNLHVDVYPGDCVILRTDRWACDAQDLRRLADKIEKLLQNNKELL